MGRVVDVAIRVEGGDAGAVFAPFVLPEGFVVAALVFPVGAHVGEEGGAAVGGEDGADVGVLAGFVAVLVVGAVAVVGPKYHGVWVNGCAMVVKGGGGEGTSYQRPWTVQWFAGPVAGSVSQN